MKLGKIFVATLAIGIMVVGASSTFANENNKINNSKETIKLENGASVIVEKSDVLFDYNNKDIKNLEKVEVKEHSSEELEKLFKDMKPGESKTLEDGSVIGVVDVNTSGTMEVNLQNPASNK